MVGGWGGRKIGAALGDAAGDLILAAINAANATSSSGTGALNGCPPSPGNQDPCKGLRDELAAHEGKLRDYIANPTSSTNDNTGILAAAVGKPWYNNIITGRIHKLQESIKSFRAQLAECEAKYGRK